MDFKFLLKPKYSNSPCVVEEGPNRLLTGGTLQGDARSAVFRLSGGEVLLEYRVFIKADRVSPFDLAASWRAYQENLQPSTVRGIPDVSINSVPESGTEVRMQSRVHTNRISLTTYCLVELYNLYLTLDDISSVYDCVELRCGNCNFGKLMINSFSQFLYKEFRKLHYVR